MEGLTPMQIGRVNKALDTEYRFTDGTRKLRAHIENLSSIEKKESDGMIDYSRSRYNKLDGAEQDKYIAGLKAKRYYWINNTKVPKIVYDVVMENA